MEKEKIPKTFYFDRNIWKTFERDFYRRKAKGEDITIQGEVEKLISAYNERG